ncbi:MAG: CpXC domain-containing protein [Elusimicrobiota bacterium]|jgi:hypothetical protein
MSIKGVVHVRCPKGCDEADVELWSFIHGDRDEAIRESLLAGDLNIVRCEECGTFFFPECTVVYSDQRAELLAFVFPESYAADEVRWRAKMNEDFEIMQRAFGGRMPLAETPQLLFGMESLREILQSDDDLEDEVLVARHLLEKMGWKMRPVLRSFARERRLPRLLPSKSWKEGEPFDVSAVAKALKALIQENDRLEGYARWLKSLESEVPPPAAAKQGVH